MYGEANGRAKKWMEAKKGDSFMTVENKIRVALVFILVILVSLMYSGYQLALKIEEDTFVKIYSVSESTKEKMELYSSESEAKKKVYCKDNQWFEENMILIEEKPEFDVEVYVKFPKNDEWMSMEKAELNDNQFMIEAFSYRDDDNNSITYKFVGNGLEREWIKYFSIANE